MNLQILRDSQPKQDVSDGESKEKLNLELAV